MDARVRRTHAGAPQSLAVTILAALLVASGCLATTAPTPERSQGQEMTVGVTPGVGPLGRTVCANAVPFVLRQMGGQAADAVEAIQARFESEPGFMAVVHDGTEPIVVVDAAHFAEWRSRLAPIRVAASCVDPGLIAAVLLALPRIATSTNGGVSGGYDALDDAILVRGVEPAELVHALSNDMQDADRVVLNAIATGALRFDPRQPLRLPVGPPNQPR
jgi:hypothetical protein